MIKINDMVIDEYGFTNKVEDIQVITNYLGQNETVVVFNSGDSENINKVKKVEEVL